MDAGFRHSACSRPTPFVSERFPGSILANAVVTFIAAWGIQACEPSAERTPTRIVQIFAKLKH